MSNRLTSGGMSFETLGISATAVLNRLIASSAFTWAWFRFFRRLAPDRTTAGLSREAILGETAQVIRAPQEDSRGMLRFATPKLGSEEWEFLCEQPVALGDRVIVKDVSGNTLIVTRR